MSLEPSVGSRSSRRRAVCSAELRQTKATYQPAPSNARPPTTQPAISSSRATGPRCRNTSRTNATTSAAKSHGSKRSNKPPPRSRCTRRSAAARREVIGVGSVTLVAGCDFYPNQPRPRLVDFDPDLIGAFVSAQSSTQTCAVSATEGYGFFKAIAAVGLRVNEMVTVVREAWSRSVLDGRAEWSLEDRRRRHHASPHFPA